MVWASTAPAAIDGLIDACMAADALVDVQIVDGPVVTDSGRLKVLTVGYVGDDEPAVVEGTSQLADMSADRSREDYTIRSMVAVLDGGGNPRQARLDAYAILSAVGGVLAASPRLDVPGVLQAALAEHSFSQSATTKGALATITFGVDVQAFSVL